MFRVLRVVSRPFGVPMDGPHAKCSLCEASVCITQCLECFPPKECIAERFQEILQGYYSDCIPLSGSAAAARPLFDILEMLEPLWLQSANKTEDWPVKFSALLDKLQQHGFCTLKPNETNLFKDHFNQQEFLWSSNQGAQTQDWVGSVVGNAVAHDQDHDSDVHKPSVARGKRPASALSRLVRRSVAPRCVDLHAMCKRSPRNPAPYLRQTALILGDHWQSDSEEQGDQSDSEEQSYQPDCEEQSNQPDSEEQSYQP